MVAGSTHEVTQLLLVWNAGDRTALDQWIPLDEAPAVSCDLNEDVAALDEALRKPAELDERKSRVVEMRFFGGLTEEEIAETLKISLETVRRDLRLAKSWLLRRLSEGPGDED